MEVVSKKTSNNNNVEVIKQVSFKTLLFDFYLNISSLTFSKPWIFLNLCTRFLFNLHT